MKTAQSSFILGLLVVGALLGACGQGLEPESSRSEELEASEADLTNSPATAGSSTVVRVNGCTGTLISPHYVVSAAHCFDVTGDRRVTVRGGQSGEQLLYDAVADVAVHPFWVDQASDREAWDVAVVHLRGAGLGARGRAKIYAGPEAPWTQKGAQLFIEGYGYGSGSGGVEDCAQTDTASLGTKRRASFHFQGAGWKDGATWLSAHVSHPDRTTCQGDSGSPYFLRRNNLDFLVGVHSRSERVAGGTARGTLVGPKLEWIKAAAQLLQPALSCGLVRDHRFPTPAYYYDCREAS